MTKHDMKTLRAKQREIAAEARAKYRSIKDDTPESEARKIERDFEALMLEHDELTAQIEELRDAADDQGDPRRPLGQDTVAAGDGGDVAAEEVRHALRPEQRMTAWAEAKKPDEYRGLSLGGYLRSMVIGAKTDTEKRALAEGSDSAGGYTVPTVLSARLIDLLRANSVVNQAGAQTVPLTSDDHSIAKLASDPTPAWRAEAGAVAESDPTFARVPLRPKSLAVMTKVSFELMEDSLNLATELPRILSVALAKELDRVALLGTGTAPEPRGIANTSGIGTTALAGALTGYSPLVAARTGILSANAGPVSAIIMHPRDEGTLTGLMDANEQPRMAPRAVEQIPMLTTTAIPTDGGAGSNESTIFAGNFSHLLIGMRSQITVTVLKERYAENMQYGLLAHMRTDIAVQHAGAFYTVTGVQG
ncbi:phage major capsid protein [Limimaricola sp. G21655-S1]|uniref:phage major capsid protein n=1 Tax=Limimaricola sp. G21655-S1 TaxID=3014768 RepID=UPI0022AF6EBE|nr:phage major capsid protein [Limimaricola sp. G21655-S1]MCZ4260973.1 phage major capsid protein [Limimaricola sp. G21655-S1]